MARGSTALQRPVEPWEDDDDDDVDQEGLTKLMDALGPDGLDDFDKAQLQQLGEDEGDDEEASDHDDDVDEEHTLGLDDDVHDGRALNLDDVSSIDQDAVPRQKIEINDQLALERIRSTIQLDPSLPWTETLSMSYPETISVDVHDDINRELGFYKQALHGATTARALAEKHSLPFTRPPDYFAEMVKSDSHMARIRQRLLDEQASIKKSEVKRKEREGKKFGKQLQIEKVKERAKSKKDMEARLSNLKRKRKDVLDQPNDNEGDDFDVVVEDAISDRPRSAKRIKESADGAPKSRSKMPRHDRNTKFGFGSGAGKRSKQNTRDSTDDFASAKPKGKFGGKGKFGVRRPDGPAKPERRSAAAKGRGKVTKRPGKSKRQSSRN